MGLGLVLATTSVYIVEIATTDMRVGTSTSTICVDNSDQIKGGRIFDPIFLTQGLLGCFVQFLGGIGVLLTFRWLFASGPKGPETNYHNLTFLLSLGAVLNWWQLAAALITLVPPFVIGIIISIINIIIVVINIIIVVIITINVIIIITVIILSK